MTRPKLPYSPTGGAANTRKTGKVSMIVYMTRDERQIVQSAANHLGMKYTDFMLEAAMQKAKSLANEIPEKNPLDSPDRQG